MFNNLLLVLSALTSTSIAYAEHPRISYVELEAIAKMAIHAEVAELNKIVGAYFSGASNNEDFDFQGYKENNLKIFKKFTKPDGMEADILYDVCVLTQETISAITAKKFTKQNLQVTSNIEAVNGLKSSMNRKFFRIAKRACINAKERFIRRLSAATHSNGVLLGLSGEAINNLAEVVFFPTEYARPGFGKVFFTALPYVINGFMIFSKIADFAGVVVDSIWLSVTSLTASSFAIKNLLPGTDEIFKQQDIDALDAKDCIRIDLTTEESALISKP